MVKIEIGAEITVPKELVDEGIIRTSLTVINQERLSLLKYSYAPDLTNVPETLEFYSETQDSWILPRSYFCVFGFAGFLESPLGDSLTFRLIDTINTNLNTIKEQSLDCSPVGVKLIDYNNYENLDIQFTKELREYQKAFLLANRVYDIKGVKTPNFCLVMPCGTGKTCVALFLMSLVRGKTLIVVTTNCLVSQWYNRTLSFTNIEEENILSANPKSKQEDIDSAWVVIITAELVAARKFDFSKFKITYFDEAHRMGAKTYHPIIKSLPSPYRIALTATMRRGDGLHEILKYHFGNTIRMENPFPKCKTWFIQRPENIQPIKNYFKLYKTTNKEDFKEYVPKHIACVVGEYVLIPDVLNYKLFLLDMNNVMSKGSRNELLRYAERTFSQNMGAIFSILAEHDQYIDCISGIIELLQHSGRKTLVLSARSSILKNVDVVLTLNKDPGGRTIQTAIVTSANNKVVGPTDIELDTNVILGIDKLAKEGLDIDFIDTLILATPITDVEQAYGRIRREFAGKKFPLVIQFSGINSFLDNLARCNPEIMEEVSETPEYVDISMLHDKL